MSIDQAISECEEKKLAAERLEFLKRSYDIFKEQERENHKIIGLEKGLKHIYQQVERIAPLSVNILISGKTGTGKEQLAHCIHQLSPRREKNLIKVNCSAIPDSLLESELFGYDKGAFTGADKNKFGKIELANGGTLFLDEIGELKLNLQVKLLRFLQEKEIERLGSNKTIKVDFRLICATNKNLEELVAQGLLREDFYYRVNSYPIHLPALNERFEDLKDLVEYFVYKTSLELGIRPPDIEHDVVEKLKQYTWPGNIRELENACRRALISCYNLGTIRANDFAFLFEKNRVDKFSFNHAINVIRDEIIYNNFDLKKIEKHILKSILDYYDNNVQQAVQKTGILKDKFYRGRKGTLVR
jgi:transcriptional regulator with PAS, ATPase and Fis domain